MVKFITWNCVVSKAAANQPAKFAITDTKTSSSSCNFINSRQIQNDCNNWNQDSNAQLTGININQKQNHKL